MTNLQEWLNKQTEARLHIQRSWLEELAAAYLLKTDVPPDQVKLVELQGEDGMTSWWFERREE